MALFLLILYSFMPSKAMAARAVMEGIKATNATIFVDTGSARVNISTGGYLGSVPFVGLNTSSNVVISNDKTDKCVIYSTGSISCSGAVNGSNTNFWSKNGTDLYPTTAGNSLTASSGTFTSSGNTQFSIRTSSGVKLSNGCIVYSDNSQTCTAPASLTSVISSATYITPGTLNSQNFGACIASVTITSNNGPIAVWFSGFIESDNSTVPIGWSVLINGAAPTSTGLSPTIGLITSHPLSSNVQTPLSGMRVLPPQGSGSKTICMQVAHPSSGAAITLKWTSPSTGNSIDSTFGAYEVK